MWCRVLLVDVVLYFIYCFYIETIYSTTNKETMTTSLYLDEETKQKATKKARKDKLSFSAVVRILLMEYADGKIVIGARSVKVEEVAVDAVTQAKMDSVVKKWRNKKK